MDLQFNECYPWVLLLRLANHLEHEPHARLTQFWNLTNNMIFTAYKKLNFQNEIIKINSGDGLEKYQSQLEMISVLLTE